MLLSSRDVKAAEQSPVKSRIHSLRDLFFANKPSATIPPVLDGSQSP